MNQLSEILKAERSKAGWNKSQMARKIGISPQLYGQYESGDKIPGGNFFIKWKAVFGYDLASKIETEGSNENKSLQITGSIMEQIMRIQNLSLTNSSAVRVILLKIAEMEANQKGISVASALLALEKEISEQAKNDRAEMKVIFGSLNSGT